MLENNGNLKFGIEQLWTVEKVRVEYPPLMIKSMIHMSGCTECDPLMTSIGTLVKDPGCAFVHAGNVNQSKS